MKLKEVAPVRIATKVTFFRLRSIRALTEEGEGGERKLKLVKAIRKRDRIKSLVVHFQNDQSGYKD